METRNGRVYRKHMSDTWSVLWHLKLLDMKPIESYGNWKWKHLSVVILGVFGGRCGFT